MLEQFKHIDKSELSMIEVAHAILEKRGTIMEFNDLLVAIQDFLELSNDELENKMNIFYTNLNIDGSFISLGENRWGLRSWYPIDSIDEELTSSLEETDTPRRKKRKKVNAFAMDEDDLDYNNDDPEDMDDLLDDEDDLDNINELSEDDDFNEELIEYHSDLDNLETEDNEELDNLTILSENDIFSEN